MSRNNIRGPTSALTDFLKSSGITATTIARRVATRGQNQGQTQVGPSNSRSAQPESSATGSTSRGRRSTRASGYASDNLDEDEADAPEEENEDATEEKTPPKTRKRKLSKAAEAKQKAQVKKKKKGKKGSDEEYQDEDDPYTSLSKSLWSNASSKPAPGSFETCAVCDQQFTVTKYTMAANPGPGYLCHVCAKASGKDPFKKPLAPRKRKPQAERREVTSFTENRLPSLLSMCIKLITKHINDVESLGDIGTMNVEAISKAISKTRSLTPENAPLFYNASNSTLTFYDATNLHSSALETLAFLNPNLTSLRLDFCGLLDDPAFKVFASSLPALTRIELLGPFLVRTEAWKAFAIAHPNLEGFLITQSPRFDLDCVRTLISHCPGIKELRLREIGKMADSFLEEIGDLKEGLTYLDISCSPQSCTDAAIIALLDALGGSLRYLNVAKHDLLTDTFLMEGLLPHSKALESLNLSHLPELTDQGLASFFSQWDNSPLVELDLSRNHELKGDALWAIMKHSGSGLRQLNINGWKEVDEQGLRMIGRKGKELKKIDVGFCREMDDFILKAWLEGEDERGLIKGGCNKVEDIKVWGCNKISEKCPRKHGVLIHGVESHITRIP